MVSGQLRVAVIGAQTCHANSPRAHTVYRTAVNYRGVCYHRLIRYRRFMAFAKKLKVAPKETPIRAKLPPKIWWSRKASMKEETVEARQVLLNEFMQEVCARNLTPKSEERLLKLVQVGEFASAEEQKAAEKKIAQKQLSTSPTERESDERNEPMQIAIVEDSVQVDSAKEEEDNDLNNYKRCSSTDDESERQSAEQQETKARSPRPEDDELDFDKLETRGDRAMSAPLTPVLNVTTRPVSMSLSNAHMKRVLFESSGDSDAGRGSVGSEAGRGSFGSEYSSTPERHYFGQIKSILAGIDDIMESSRKHEGRIRDLQAKSDATPTKSLV